MRLKEELVLDLKHGVTIARLEEALRLSEKFAANQWAEVEAAIDAVPASIAVLDANGVILRVNKAWSLIAHKSGITSDAVAVGAHYLAVCDAVVGEEVEQARSFAAGIRKVISKETAHFSMEYSCHSQEGPRWFIGSVTAIVDKGPARVVVTHIDITEQKATEENSRKLNRELEGRMHALQAELVIAQRLALISEVSAGIIHQLSQPLSNLGVNFAVLRKLKAVELEQCGAMEIFNDVEADVTRMRGIVHHLRSIANTERVAREKRNLNELAAEVLPLLQARADHGRVRLKLDLGVHLPAIHADATQLSQVIFNLMSNAIEASAGVILRRRVVIITTRQHTEHSVEFCVSDSGCGLSAEILEQLFTPFFSTKSAGMGVGLRLCQTIVHAHHGQIEGFNNADGHGATFRVELPVGPPPPTFPAGA